jgi:hypothetical protein
MKNQRLVMHGEEAARTRSHQTQDPVAAQPTTATVDQDRYDE